MKAYVQSVRNDSGHFKTLVLAVLNRKKPGQADFGECTFEETDDEIVIRISKLTEAPSHVRGHDIDQIALDQFGLQSTRTDAKLAEMRRLSRKATLGDTDASLAFLRSLSRGETEE